MNKEEIALQLALKSLEKFRLEKASQVAEIYNIIYENLRYPEQKDEQAAEQPRRQGPEGPQEKSVEESKVQPSGRPEAQAAGERKEQSSKKGGKSAKGERMNSSKKDKQEAVDSEELTHKLGEALNKSEEQSKES